MDPHLKKRETSLVWLLVIIFSKNLFYEIIVFSESIIIVLEKKNNAALKFGTISNCRLDLGIVINFSLINSSEVTPRYNFSFKSAESV